MSSSIPQHEGRNIKRFREMIGMKQARLAMELGEGWTQKKVSAMEKREKVNPLVLKHIAEIMKTKPEILKKFDEAAARRGAESAGLDQFPENQL